MKNFPYPFLAIFFIILNFSVQAESISSALNNHKVQVSIFNNSSSTHYHSPLSIEVSNITNASLNLSLDNGTILEANKEEFQNFIVTERLLVNLGPNEKKTIDIHGMCIEQSDMAPNDEVLYTIGGEASSQMKQLGLFIEKNKQFEPDAQFLMWELAENKFNNIEKIDFEMDEYGEIWVVEEKDNQRERVIEEQIEDESKPMLMVSGNFTMTLASNKNVHIAMFNKNNILVKELYNNPKTPGGETALSYEFNSYDFEDDEYFMKVVLDGEIILERTIDMTY